VAKAACIVDREGGKAGFQVPFVQLIAYEVEVRDEKGCPLC
jgi:hypothetical protein